MVNYCCPADLSFGENKGAVWVIPKIRIIMKI